MDLAEMQTDTEEYRHDLGAEQAGTVTKVSHQSRDNRIRLNAEPESRHAHIGKDAVAALNEEKRHQHDVAEQ